MREQESKSPKELLHDRILEVLEENAALCLDVQVERQKLVGDLTEILWNRDRKPTSLENEDFQI